MRSAAFPREPIKLPVQRNLTLTDHSLPDHVLRYQKAIGSPAHAIVDSALPSAGSRAARLTLAIMLEEDGADDLHLLAFSCMHLPWITFPEEQRNAKEMLRLACGVEACHARYVELAAGRVTLHAGGSFCWYQLCSTS